MYFQTTYYRYVGREIFYNFSVYFSADKKSGCPIFDIKFFKTITKGSAYKSMAECTFPCWPSTNDILSKAKDSSA